MKFRMGLGKRLISKMENRPGIKVSVGREIAKKLCSTNTKELLVLRLLRVSFYLFNAIIRGCKS